VSTTAFVSFPVWHASAACWGAVWASVLVSLDAVPRTVRVRRNVVARRAGRVGPVAAVRIRVGEVFGPSKSLLWAV
jgi:hypothetical protein